MSEKDGHARVETAINEIYQSETEIAPCDGTWEGQFVGAEQAKMCRLKITTLRGFGASVYHALIAATKRLRAPMAFQVDRSPFDPESGFEYYICFKPPVEVEGDEVSRESRSRPPSPYRRTVTLPIYASSSLRPAAVNTPSRT